MRDKNRIEPFLKQLQILWEQNPDLRFGQLIYTLNQRLRKDGDTFNVEDDEYLEQINKYIKNGKIN